MYPCRGARSRYPRNSGYAGPAGEGTGWKGARRALETPFCYLPSMLKDAVPLGEIAHALVIMLRHHGDALLAAPVLGALKAQAPKVEIDALVYDDTAPMLEGHPALSRLHTVGRNWKEEGFLSRIAAERRLFGTLRARRYDLIVHLTEQPRGAWLARALGARYSVAPVAPQRGAFWKGSFTHLYPLARSRHKVEANLDALRRHRPAARHEERRRLSSCRGRGRGGVTARFARRSVRARLHQCTRIALELQCWTAERATRVDRPSSRRIGSW